MTNNNNFVNCIFPEISINMTIALDTVMRYRKNFNFFSIIDISNCQNIFNELICRWRYRYIIGDIYLSSKISINIFSNRQLYQYLVRNINISLNIWIYYQGRQYIVRDIQLSSKISIYCQKYQN